MADDLPSQLAAAKAELRAYREWADTEVRIAEQDAAYWREHIAKSRRVRRSAMRMAYTGFVALSKIEWSRTGPRGEGRCPLCYGCFPVHTQTCAIGLFFTKAEGRFLEDDSLANVHPRFRRAKMARGKDYPMPIMERIVSAIADAARVGCRYLEVSRLDTLDIRVLGGSEDDLVEFCEDYDRMGVM